MKAKEKVTAKWSKKENDWLIRWPEYKNRNGKITANFISGMIEYANNYVKQLGCKDLRDYFESGGFDPDTFEIKIHAKLGQIKNTRIDGEPNC